MDKAALAGPRDSEVTVMVWKKALEAERGSA